MTTYVLIMILYYGHDGFSQEFNSLEKCDAAGQATIAMVNAAGLPHLAKYKCVEK